MEFKELGLIEPLLRAVKEAGYEKPSPIQQKAIPPVLAGRDMLGCAQTGTGKTAAFALPILQLLSARQPGGKRVPIRALVLTPTRELALQIEENFEQYGKHLALRSTVIFGGVGQAPQVAALRRGIDILVATPGRLNDLIGQGFIDLAFVEVFVLDEADRMLDMGFVNDVKKVLKQLPPKKQTLLFSATLPREIVQLATGLLHNPAKVFVAPPSTTVETVQQSVYKVDKANKRRLLAHLLQSGDVHSALVFTRTKHGADRVARDLGRDGIKAAAIHGNKSQGARQEALKKFKAGKVKALVATDIAARGLDINELSHVFNFDLPNMPETYVHRIGRTGRAGHGGIAISFCNYDELEYLADIEKLIGFAVPEVKSHPWPMQVLQKTEKKPSAARGAKPAQQAKTPQRQVQPKPEKPKNKQGNSPQKAETQKSPKTQSGNSAAAKQENKKQATRSNQPKQAGRPPIDPYANRTGGSAIVNKRPIWGDAPATAEPPAPKGDETMARNNNRRRGGKNRNKNRQEANPPKEAAAKPVKPQNPNGVYDFSEEELAKDDSIQVISRTNSETKYASFEDFLKDH